MSYSGGVDQPLSAMPVASAFPSNLPSKIVPPNAPLTAPEGSTLISILFDAAAYTWPFVVTSDDSAGQILLVMPTIIGKALNMTASVAINSALAAYQPSNFNGDANTLQVLYLGYVQSELVDALQAALSTPTSYFYTATTGLASQIAAAVDPTLKLTSFSNTQQAIIGDGTTTQQQSTVAKDDSNKRTIIAVVASFGSVIVLLAAFLGFRYIRRKKTTGLSQQRPSARTSDPSTLSSSPGMTSRGVFSGVFSQHNAAGRPMSGVSDASSGSGHSSAHSVGGGRDGTYHSRGVSWYSGRYTDFGSEDGETDENSRTRGLHRSFVASGTPSREENPFADRRFSGGDRRFSGGSGGAADPWMARNEGVRRLKTGQVTISRPQLEGNSLM